MFLSYISFIFTSNMRILLKDKMGLWFFDVSNDGMIYKCIQGKVLLTVVFECLICQAIAITVRTKVRTAITIRTRDGQRSVTLVFRYR